MQQIIADSAYFGVVLSLSAYGIGMMLKKRLKWTIFNPILIAAALSIGALLLLRVDYPSYYSSAKYLSWLLTPATVCLAIPLYEQIQLLKKHFVAILLGISAGVVASVGSILALAFLMNMTPAESATLLPKSITTAIGVSVSETMGGYPSITAIVIILTGVAGNVLAEGFLKLIRVTNPIARGIAIGTASHAVGTSRAMELGEVEGAMSGLSIAVAGLLTVIAASLLTL